MVNIKNKNNINKISSVFYSHWHHDHVAGMALFENINKELNNCLGDEGTINHEVKLFIPKDLLKVLEQNTYFKEVLVKRKYVKPVVGEYHDLNGFSLEIIRMCDLPCYCLIISKDEKKVAICMDHGKYLNDIKDKLDNLDLLICNAGFFNKELKGLDVISEEHPLNKTTSFESTMKLIKEIKPKKTVFLHIEELWNKTLGDFEAIEKEHSKYNIKFAMDGLKINL